MSETRPVPSFDADEVEAFDALGLSGSSRTSCPDSSLLLALNEGVLDEMAAERLRAHLRTCATCQMLARDLAAVLDDAPTAEEHARLDARIAAGRERRRRPIGVWLGVGGLVAAAGLAGILLLPPSSPSPAGGSSATAAHPAPPTVFVVDRPSMPPGDVDLTVRGEASTRASLANEVAAALDAADRGDLASAVTTLTALTNSNPTSRIAALALGAVQLRAGRDADALATLDRAHLLKSDPESADEAGWFLAVALVRTGNGTRARLLLDAICKQPSSARRYTGVRGRGRDRSRRRQKVAECASLPRSSSARWR